MKGRSRNRLDRGEQEANIKAIINNDSNNDTVKGYLSCGRQQNIQNLKKNLPYQEKSHKRKLFLDFSIQISGFLSL
jgi:hypothetical protein